MPFGAVAAAVAPAAISAISGAIQSGSASSGASAASAASQQAIAAATANSQPFITAGTNALGASQDLLGLNGADAASKAMAGFTASPGYDYSVKQGLRAVDAGAAASGMLRSGATLKAEQTLGTNLANQEFGNYFGRLNSLTTTGAGAANSLNSIISGQGTNQAQIANNQGAQQASIYGNVAQGVTNGIGIANKNGLFDGFGGGGSSYGGTSGFGTGAGGANSAGANSLQSLGFYKPLGSV